jgi:hypothetical protein
VLPLICPGKFNIGRHNIYAWFLLLITCNSFLYVKNALGMAILESVNVINSSGFLKIAGVIEIIKNVKMF